MVNGEYCLRKVYIGIVYLKCEEFMEDIKSSNFLLLTALTMLAPMVITTRFFQGARSGLMSSTVIETIPSSIV